MSVPNNKYNLIFKFYFIVLNSSERLLLLRTTRLSLFLDLLNKFSQNERYKGMGRDRSWWAPQGCLRPLLQNLGTSLAFFTPKVKPLFYEEKNTHRKSLLIIQHHYCVLCLYLLNLFPPTILIHGNFRFFIPGEQTWTFSDRINLNLRVITRICVSHNSYSVLSEWLPLQWDFQGLWFYFGPE